METQAEMELEKSTGKRNKEQFKNLMKHENKTSATQLKI
jgi:hypothetical protein